MFEGLKFPFCCSSTVRVAKSGFQDIQQCRDVGKVDGGLEDVGLDLGECVAL